MGAAPNAPASRRRSAADRLVPAEHGEADRRTRPAPRAPPRRPSARDDARREDPERDAERRRARRSSTSRPSRVSVPRASSPPVSARRRSYTSTASASRSASKHGLGDVAEVLAVGLERQRPVAPHPERVEVVPGEHAPVVGERARGTAATSEARHRAPAPICARARRSRAPRRSRPAARPRPAPGRRRCRDGRSRPGRTPRGRTPRPRAAGVSRSRSRRAASTTIADEGRVARPPALGGRARARRRDAPPRRRARCPAEKQKRRPLTRPSPIERLRPATSASTICARGGDLVSRQPERAREDARAAAGHEPERQLAGGAVDRLVVGAVAREDDDRVGIADRGLAPARCA